MGLPIPQSLVNPTGASADDRRYLAGLLADNSAPTAGEKGVHTRNHQYLHFTGLSRVGTSFDATLYVKYAFSQEWAIATWWGTSGVTSVTTAGGAVIVEPLLLLGIDAVYVQVDNFVGVDEAADVWLAGSSFD